MAPTTKSAGKKDGKRRIGRGTFLKGSGALLTLAALGGVGAWQTVGPGGRPAAAQAGLPLPGPPLLPVRRLEGPRGGMAEAEIAAAPTTASLAGANVQALAYEGSVPGTTLRLRKGERARVRFVNRLEEPTNLHLHGGCTSRPRRTPRSSTCGPARTTSTSSTCPRGRSAPTGITRTLTARLRGNLAPVSPEP